MEDINLREYWFNDGLDRALEDSMNEQGSEIEASLSEEQIKAEIKDITAKMQSVYSSFAKTQKTATKYKIS